MASRARLALFLLPVLLAGCRKWRFPDAPANFREFAYVSNRAGGTVSVLDLVSLRPAGVLGVGRGPGDIVANPVRNELYVVNTEGDSVTVIDAETNSVAATIPVHRRPSHITVDAGGEFAWVSNAGANTVSVLNLKQRRELGAIGTGEQPTSLRISPDGRSLVVSNTASNSVSVFEVSRQAPAKLRTTFAACPGAGDIAILPDSSKVFVACSAAETVLAASLAAAPASWAAKQDSEALADHLLAYLRVGPHPQHLAMKPDGGEIFVSNNGGDSISEISTSTNEVGGSYPIGNGPVQGLVSADNSTLWVCNAGADAVSIYSIDDGRLTNSVRTGGQPIALALSADEHLLLAADARTGDVAVIRTHDRNGPALFTMLPAGSQPAALAIKAFTAKQN